MAARRRSSTASRAASARCCGRPSPSCPGVNQLPGVSKAPGARLRRLAYRPRGRRRRARPRRGVRRRVRLPAQGRRAAHLPAPARVPAAHGDHERPGLPLPRHRHGPRREHDHRPPRHRGRRGARRVHRRSARRDRTPRACCSTSSPPSPAGGETAWESTSTYLRRGRTSTATPRAGLVIADAAHRRRRVAAARRPRPDVRRGLGRRATRSTSTR